MFRVEKSWAGAVPHTTRRTKVENFMEVNPPAVPGSRKKDSTNRDGSALIHRLRTSGPRPVPGKATEDEMRATGGIPVDSLERGGRLRSISSKNINPPPASIPPDSTATLIAINVDQVGFFSIF